MLAKADANPAPSVENETGNSDLEKQTGLCIELQKLEINLSRCTSSDAQDSRASLEF